MNQPKQKPPRVVTKSCLLNSDEHVQMYDEKRQAEEAKQKRKDE